MISLVILGFAYYRSLDYAHNIEELYNASDRHDVGGRYIASSSVIIVYTNYNIIDIQRIANHEICHKIWYAKLNKGAMKEYEAIYNNATYFITEYSKTDVVEDFAEHCSYWMLGKDDFYLGEERKAFMDTYVDPITYG